MLTHLFFDAGHTLVFPNFRLVAEKLALRGPKVAIEDLERGDMKARYQLDDPDLIRSSTDHSRWTVYFETIFRHCGVTEAAIVREVLAELQAIHKVSNLWEVVPPEVPAALEALKPRFRLSVISNANGTVREKLRRVGLLDFFDSVLDSHEEGIEKPDPRIFHAAMKRNGARAEQSLYVGDMYHIDVAGARAAGMEVFLLDPGGLHADKPVRRIPGLGALASSIDAPR
ncbi:MAG TPA: HAD family hydrolase [Planctomycetota bacterium]|jgi:putative hydrolase of the HAD superfamily|nr:HAD family hydrolase [Planctomycetota bacterium]